ncbi:helix-turn-helix transcriptional regulator [Bradyrhizobium sp. USDA 4454]
MHAAENFPEQLLDLIYDAATDETLWSDVLVRIAELTASVNGVLFGQVVGDSKVFFNHHTLSREECLRAYRERYVKNPYALHMDRQHNGAIVRSDEIAPLSELKKTEFYHDVLRPQRVAHAAMISLAKRSGFSVVFHLCRGERQGPFEEPQIGILRRLRPHLCRSIELGFRLEAYKSLRETNAQALDCLAIGVIFLDRSRRIILANEAARLFGAADGPLRLRNGTVSAFAASFSRRLDDLVQAVLRGLPAATMSMPHPEDGRLINLLVSSVRSRDIDRLQRLHPQRAAAMIFVLDPAGPGELPATSLMDIWQLTLAEARAALCVARGCSVAEIARRLGVSPNTVKTHLRRVFAKTGVRSQVELAGLIAPLKLLGAGQSETGDGIDAGNRRSSSLPLPSRGPRR